MKSHALGVAVVRVQVPELHAGHHYLLNSMLAIHANALVVIGDTPAQPSAKDPLSYEIRRAMVRDAFPTARVEIARLVDQPDHQQWSAALDDLIASRADGGAETVLYGGRDSFLTHYVGRHRIFELPPTLPMSGTAIRQAIGLTHTTDFRRGMIYAAANRFPTSYQCVDVAVMKHGQLVLGQKRMDNGKWRFIGGFVSPEDSSLEGAAQREVREETGVEPGIPIYVGSMQIDDYRYRKGGRDSLMTAFFAMEYMFGAPKAADDLDACRMATIQEAEHLIADQHMPLFHMLCRHLNAGEMHA